MVIEKKRRSVSPFLHSDPHLSSNSFTAGPPHHPMVNSFHKSYTVWREWLSLYTGGVEDCCIGWDKGGEIEGGTELPEKGCGLSG